MKSKTDSQLMPLTVTSRGVGMAGRRHGVILRTIDDLLESVELALKARAPAPAKVAEPDKPAEAVPATVKTPDN